MKHSFRIDFRFVNVGSEEDPEIVSILDPDRYEYVNDGRFEGYRDMLDDRRFRFTMESIRELLLKSADMPLSNIAPVIGDVRGYILSRQAEITEGLRDGFSNVVFSNISNDELAALAGRKEYFVIASIDLVGSTELSQTVEPQLWSRIIQVYSREIARLCALFHGRPLKFMGDGILVYFPTGSQIRRHDLASDCALSVRDVVLLGINPALAHLGLPEIGCRIGVDSGDAYIVTIGDSSTTNQMDIIGHVVDIATKVEKLAGRDEICVGEAAVRQLHTMWLKHVIPLELSADWPYRDNASGKPYRVYKLDIPI
jgi:class 3 adenylate cyclase